MPSLEIEIVRCFDTNYSYLICDAASGACAAVDPGDASKVAYAISKRKLKLTHILCTHHHDDHIGGNDTLKMSYGAKIYCSAFEARIPGRDFGLKENAPFKLFGHDVAVLETPGHTLGSVCFLVDGNLFTGDTLFAMGCGKLFEGSARKMAKSLAKLAALPGDTKIYPGHEYTVADGRFALTLEPNNAALTERCRTAETADPGTLAPFTLAAEKATNPFLRTDSAEIRTRLGAPADQPADEVFGKIRVRKDMFRG